MTAKEIFEGIGQDSITRMLSCFKAEQRCFKRGELIMIYAPDPEYLCILTDGKAHLYCMDSDGEAILLEQYGVSDIFGEIFALPYGDLGYAVEADSECKVLFIRLSCIFGRCPNACQHHSQLTRNLFELSAKKAQGLAIRISLISRRSLRRKLSGYFEYMSDVTGRDFFELEISMSGLASYLCADRASMMRELKRMCDDGLIQRKGRQIRILREPQGKSE